ncbi:MAG: hypothetical protein VKL39_04810, partial [Leptolyngbyaceae bacterium]|nr:hypothetical protein [Leptolyngbyaceae bacterium]
IDESAIQAGMAETQWPGRIQWVPFQDAMILIDGAHNTAAAHTLRDYVEQSEQVSRHVHWVMGMLDTKDHADIFNALLRTGDRLSVVPVPDHQSADPHELVAIAQHLCPTLDDCRVCTDVFAALEGAMTRGGDRTAPPRDVRTASPSELESPENNEEKEAMTIVLCGSLYLIGYFFKHLRGQP